MDDRREVLVKTPRTIAGSDCFATASEVATLKFLRQSTSLPVPRVLAWNADLANEIGSECIIMEKTPGVALYGIWEGLSTLQRYSIIEKVVAMEKELACLEFSAYGALYLRGSEPANLRYHPVSDALDSADSFCVGPLCNARSKQGGGESSRDSGTSGPWVSLAEFASSPTQIKTRTKQTCQKDDGGEPQSTMHENPDLPDPEGQDLLESISTILPILCSDHRILKVSKPTLWHPGLSLDNILVSATDPTRILGIIGWRSAAILPLFLQTRFPRFLATPPSYNPGDPLPSLAGLASWSPEQKQSALRLQGTLARSRYYEMCIVEHDSHLAHEAMNLDRNLSGLFRCRDSLDLADGDSKLRSHLQSIAANWIGLGLPGTCPVTIRGGKSRQCSMRWEGVSRS
ncbi:uncharacterized protein BO72DRAFT_416407 [Aspergillus fijiensis CBS 313.89]|uniref:Altered inheritance of mitochondria protein 9, mitochondrial n=1 Tax=Aspergillus fijiensis CBS 313.89 TaxID=1448319 RepID=A0A8G1RJV2_9EURO|nr:uncharacterized protein BO72DRAFT_416407 [Aspergillus fijiensis CBS 313.89]RAK71781.1 hypothetical protein BO72DRAFT_416407 [Aspergillus fijiensis CBS 313.89]